ncbi:glycosyltransferase family 48 protein [Rhizophagus clarus]|uniref:1,3-beta-glucan synthase n=1 Tax=Rhizophagus clarus TaxID=94130 RepID=A0A8H3QAG6_9GLOM|nr:glycosyltransferase family 48 protein [Rhizophagus clarus]
MAYSQLNNINNNDIPVLPQQTVQQIYNSGHELRFNEQYTSYDTSTSSYLTSSQGSSNFQRLDLSSPAYPERDIDVPSEDSIREIFITLKNKFGFQIDNSRNMFKHLMCMLDSRASRMNPYQALFTLYADYIGGINANYRKWCLAMKFERNVDSKNVLQDQQQWNEQMDFMSKYPEDMVRQLALWLLLWGEASPVRLMSECLCFIFKLAIEYDKGFKSSQVQLREGDYLDNIITPIYRYIKDQCYEDESGKLMRKEKDHAETISYDDINELFWNRETINNIVFQRKSDSSIESLMDVHHSERYLELRHVKWDLVFVKTYKEKRTWLHLAVNFTRIWIIEFAILWYFMAYINLFFYNKDKIEIAVQWSILAIGGTVSTLLVIIGTICELFFVPLRNKLILTQLLILIIVFIINFAPIFIIMKDPTSLISLIIGIVHIIISLITTFIFAIIPRSRIFSTQSEDDAHRVFTANYAHLSNKDRATSIGLWCCVFVCKLVVSYFLSHLFIDFLKSILKMRVIDSTLCTLILALIIIIMFSNFIILLLSSTYLWYVIWNIIFSIAICTPIWAPKKNNLTTLPKHICTKILGSNDMKINDVSQIWNSIIISMYNESKLSQNVKNLLYLKGNDIDSWNAPPIFVDHNNDQYYPPMSEVERRIAFFAKSLSNNIQDPLPIKKMPTFTVFTPHYSEKILFSLREICEKDQNTRLNLFEYLKQLHPTEWENFEQNNNLGIWDSIHIQDYLKKQVNSIEEDENLRKCKWVSCRMQTLFRTISGFMNYQKAIKLLYRIENPDLCANDPEKLENEMSLISRRKFNFLISMQRYNEFNEEELRNVDFLLRSYPDLQIAYLEQVPQENQEIEPKFFSVLIDGHCEILPDGKRKPIYRIQLPGNPILGNGKSDNQNHAIIFYRGEYIQLIDANQDNYFEECLKIRNILGEFEQYNMPKELIPDTKPGTNEVKITIPPYSELSNKHPVAIVGACEYIFSKNCGALGDLTAGKGQAFGTLTQRIIAKVGGKLHYGHPDFLNAIFMTTRGGVSKARKGLHLSEDIFAGINSLSRGGRIKHCEYIQCGKGRDLGFESILHFTTKTSTGFHFNHIFIMLSVHLFMLGMMLIGAIRIVLPICDNSQDVCPEFIPTINWIKCFIILTIIASFIDFLPLFSQEFEENGLIRSVLRFGKHLISLSPLFEVFNTQIYANSIMTNINFGGAKYIFSGRGFSTTRIPFSILYSRFSGPSIFFGMRILLILLFVSLTIWTPYFLYLWFSVIALCVSPFLFNLQQFSFVEFVNDYREFLIWMYSETRTNSWINYCRTSIMFPINYKLGYYSVELVENTGQLHFTTAILKEIISSFIIAVICIIVFVFIKSLDSATSGLPNIELSIITYICMIAIGPILMNIVALFISFCLKSIFNRWINKFEELINFITNTFAIINLIGTIEYLWISELQKPVNAILSIIVITAIQRFIFKVITNLYRKKLGCIQPFYDKVIEMFFFAKDFILGHILLFILAPICLILKIDKLHFIILFWSKPNKKIITPIFLQEQKYNIWIYGLVFIIMFMIFISLIIGPIMINLKL